MNVSGALRFKWELLPEAGYVLPAVRQSTRASDVIKHVDDTGLVRLQFGHPGTYQLEVFTGDERVYHGRQRVQYVRREVESLTPREWREYVNAVWTLRNTSTHLGRQRFGETCVFRNDDYREYDFFVLFHAFHSADERCDQLHFSMFQEFAHEAWITMFERALQCVHPAVTLHYWDAIRDSHLRENASVWNSTMYGKAWTDETGIDSFVSDGAFAWFPVRANRTGLCEYMDESDQPRCLAFIDDSNFPWRGHANDTGFRLHSSDVNVHAHVSRRTGYLFGLGQEHIEQVFPNHSLLPRIMNKTSVEAIKLISGDEVHGYAHYWMSGLWGTDSHDGDVGIDLNLAFLDMPPNENFAELLRFFVWPMDARGRADWLYSCSYGCDPAWGGWWFTNDNLTLPTNSFDVQWHGYSEQSMWYEWLASTRGRRTQWYQQFGPMDRLVFGGTFDRSATANQDPLFYLHHSFTFSLLHKALASSLDDPPHFNLDAYSVHECPGHRLNDTTVFANLVPYKLNSNDGARHTWRDILEHTFDESLAYSKWR